MTKLNPFSLRDFSGGRITKYSVADSLAPDKSVANSVNVNFDTILGSATVRNGTVPIEASNLGLPAGKTPIGLFDFHVLAGSALLAAFPVTTATTIFNWKTATGWTASDFTTLGLTAKVRFATLGGRVFAGNGTLIKSSADGATWLTTNCPSTIKPSLFLTTQGRLLASGDTTSGSDRVWFSSVIDSSGAITWNENTTTGDFITINPDDGDTVTALARTSSTVLVFKNNGIYRLDVLSKQADADNIFNIGTPAQECVVECQGYVYFFSGIDIRRTNGGFPEQISRFGVQDFIDAIPSANWQTVCSGTDGFNVYFSIGDVTLNANTDSERAYSNVVLKFSTRDNAWSVHSYYEEFKFFTSAVSQYTNIPNKNLIGASVGNVCILNRGFKDSNTYPIYFEMETQDLEFGNRAHKKQLSKDLIVYANKGTSTVLEANVDDNGWKTLPIMLDKRVNRCKGINLGGHYISFRWSGNTTTTSPVFEGIYIEDINDTGME